jgi:hypothetical protein
MVTFEPVASEPTDAWAVSVASVTPGVVVASSGKSPPLASKIRSDASEAVGIAIV